MEFSRQACWSGLPFPSPGDLPDTEIEPEFPTLQWRDSAVLTHVSILPQTPFPSRGQLIFDKGAERTKDNCFLTNRAGQLDIHVENGESQLISHHT